MAAGRSPRRLEHPRQWRHPQERAKSATGTVGWEEANPRPQLLQRGATLKLPAWLWGTVCRNGNVPAPSPFRTCWGALLMLGTSCPGGISRWKEEGISAGSSQDAGLGGPTHQMSATCLGPNSAAPQWGCLGLEVCGASHSPLPLGLASRAGLTVRTF